MVPCTISSRQIDGETLETVTDFLFLGSKIIADADQFAAWQPDLGHSYDIMQVRKQQLELDMEQHTGSKQEKEYIKAVYCHPAYLTYIQSTS